MGNRYYDENAYNMSPNMTYQYETGTSNINLDKIKKQLSTSEDTSAPSSLRSSTSVGNESFILSQPNGFNGSQNIRSSSSSLKSSTSGGSERLIVSPLHSSNGEIKEQLSNSQNRSISSMSLRSSTSGGSESFILSQPNVFNEPQNTSTPNRLPFLSYISDLYSSLVESNLNYDEGENKISKSSSFITSDHLNSHEFDDDQGIDDNIDNDGQLSEGMLSLEDINTESLSPNINSLKENAIAKIDKENKLTQKTNETEIGMSISQESNIYDSSFSNEGNKKWMNKRKNQKQYNNLKTINNRKIRKNEVRNIEKQLNGQGGRYSNIDLDLFESETKGLESDRSVAMNTPLSDLTTQTKLQESSQKSSEKILENINIETPKPILNNDNCESHNLSLNRKSLDIDNNNYQDKQNINNRLNENTAIIPYYDIETKKSFLYRPYAVNINNIAAINNIIVNNGILEKPIILHTFHDLESRTMISFSNNSFDRLNLFLINRDSSFNLRQNILRIIETRQMNILKN